jgi:hypothetical protein
MLQLGAPPRGIPESALTARQSERPPGHRYRCPATVSGGHLCMPITRLIVVRRQTLVRFYDDERARTTPRNDLPEQRCAADHERGAGNDQRSDLHRGEVTASRGSSGRIFTAAPSAFTTNPPGRFANSGVRHVGAGWIYAATKEDGWPRGFWGRHSVIAADADVCVCDQGM